MAGDSPRYDRRQLILGGTLLAAAGTAFVARPRRAYAALAPERLDAAIPTTLGDYRYRPGDDIILPDRDDDSLKVYQQYVARTYVAPGAPPISLLIAYGAAQDYALQVHRPESCYPPAGFALGASRTIALPIRGVGTIDAVALTARRLDRVDHILYWTRVGDAYPDTLWRQRAVMVRQLLARRVPDGVLVRLSTQGDDAPALARLAAFNALLLAAIAPAGRGLLLGASAARSTA